MMQSEINFISSVTFSDENTKPGIFILDTMFNNSCEILLDNIVNVINNNEFNLSAISIYLRKSLKKITIYKNFYKIYRIHYTLNSGFLVYCLNKIQAKVKKSCIEYAVILDSDGSNYAAALVKIIG